ncbi:MAG TPA: HEAT repeat domain-containing protein [Bryobacteraceae bacterium]
MTESLSAAAATPNEALEETLLHLAKTDPAKFRILCRRIREASPERLDHTCEQIARTCIREIATHGKGSKDQPMLSWVIADGRYLNLLLDPDFLSLEEAKKVSTFMREADSGFFLKFEGLTSSVNAERDLRRLERALHLFVESGTSNVLVPWLRSLTNHADKRIRSKAVKSLCALRPNSALVEKQLSSDDARVRANAIEALWGTRSQEAASLFREALNDSSHRVVVNALVGLHFHDPEEALEILLRLCKHSAPLFRAAAAWGLGRIADTRAIPALKTLVEDSSDIVRERAARVLEAFAAD